MDLQNSFVVPTSLDEAWRTLLDVERIAPCLPGAALDGEVEPGTYQGRVKIKVGPIVTTYRGTITFESVDEAGRRVVLLAKGKEMRGAGTAEAHVVATLSDVTGTNGPAAQVDVTTDLGLTGKPAQFGRAVLGEVSAKLVQQFADNLALQLRGGPTASPGDRAPGDPAPGGLSAGAPAASAASGIATDAAPSVTEPEPLDLMQLAGGSIAKRAVPGALLATVVGLVVFVVIRRVLSGRR
jgi:uncharacterized protein